MSKRNPFTLFRVLGRSLLPFLAPSGGPIAPPGFVFLLGADGAP
ncbi:hypothetical protein ACFQE0_13795 [Methylobacterium komagatae]|uniref:Uncharacterized protein n=1 Tax=Methylobacterium komagatae TaxID=374425 RepID=A0ABW2BJI6_9HYPH